MVVNARDIQVGEVPQPVGRSMFNWMKYTTDSGVLQRITHRGAEAIIADSNLKNLTVQTKTESALGFPTLNGHLLMGMCSAFETFISDLFVDFVADTPEILHTKPFENIHVPAATLLDSSDNRYAVLLRSAKNELRKKSREPDPALKFESLLKLIGMDGSVPDQVKDSVRSALAIRNLWAHHSGTVSQEFVKSNPNLPAKVGTRFEVNTPEYALYADGLFMYTTIVLCRHERTRMSYEFNDQKGYEGTLRRVWPNDSDWPQDTSAPESDAPPE